VTEVQKSSFLKLFTKYNPQPRKNPNNDQNRSHRSQESKDETTRGAVRQDVGSREGRVIKPTRKPPHHRRPTPLLQKLRPSLLPTQKRLNRGRLSTMEEGRTNRKEGREGSRDILPRLPQDRRRTSHRGFSLLLYWKRFRHKPNRTPHPLGNPYPLACRECVRSNHNQRRTQPMSRNILEELDQRINEMIKQDKETNEHPNATLSDYVDWAIEEIALNK
jgi:hypothetical protein